MVCFSLHYWQYLFCSQVKIVHNAKVFLVANSFHFVSVITVMYYILHISFQTIHHVHDSIFSVQMQPWM